MSKVRKRNKLNLKRYKDLKNQNGTRVLLGTRSFVKGVHTGALQGADEVVTPSPYRLSASSFLVLFDFWFSFRSFCYNQDYTGSRSLDFRLTSSLFIVFCCVASSGGGISIRSLLFILFDRETTYRNMDYYIYTLSSFGLVVRVDGLIYVSEFGELFIRDSVGYDTLRSLSKIVKSVL